MNDLLYTTTALLDATRRLLPFNLLLAALNGWRADSMLTLIVWALLTLAALWLHWRIAFDVAIFRRWMNENADDISAFDTALADLGLRRARPHVPLAERCRGAARLCKRLLLLTLLQTVASVISACT